MEEVDMVGLVRSQRRLGENVDGLSEGTDVFASCLLTR
jgi:hypothetical protein